MKRNALKLVVSSLRKYRCRTMLFLITLLRKKILSGYILFINSSKHSKFEEIVSNFTPKLKNATTMNKFTIQKTRTCCVLFTIFLMFLLPITVYGLERTSITWPDPNTGKTIKRTALYENQGSKYAAIMSCEYFAVRNGTMTVEHPYIQVEFSHYTDEGWNDKAHDISISIVTDADTRELFYAAHGNDSQIPSGEECRNTAYGVVTRNDNTYYKSPGYTRVIYSIYPTEALVKENIKKVIVTECWDEDDNGGPYSSKDGAQYDFSVSYEEDISCTDNTAYPTPTFDRTNWNTITMTGNIQNYANKYANNWFPRYVGFSFGPSSDQSGKVGMNLSSTNQAAKDYSVSDDSYSTKQNAPTTIYYNVNSLTDNWGITNVNGTTQFINSFIPAVTSASTTVKACAYAANIKVTDFNLFTLTTKLYWEGMNTDATKYYTDGKWHIFMTRYTKNSNGTYTQKDRTEIAKLDLATTTYEHQFTKDDYDMYLTYEVVFLRDSWTYSATSPTFSQLKDLGTQTSYLSTIRSFDINLEQDVTDSTSVTLKWSYPEIKSSTIPNVTIERSTDNQKTWSTTIINQQANTPGENMSANKYTDKTANSECDNYFYRMSITTMDKTWTKIIGPCYPVNGSYLTKLSISKGTYSNVAKATWKVKQRGVSDTHFVLLRRLLGSKDSADWKEIHAEQGTKDNYSYDDNTAQPGQYYEYKIECYSRLCPNATDTPTSLTDVGFCANTGIITGRITYGTGTAVPNARITLIKGSEDNSDRRQFSSLLINGRGSRLEWQPTAAQITELFNGKTPFTIQLWVNPNSDITNNDNNIITSSGKGYAEARLIEICDNIKLNLIRKDGSSYYLKLYGNPGTGQKEMAICTDLIVPAAKFTNVALTYDGSQWSLRKVDGDNVYVSTSKSSDACDMSKSSIKALTIGGTIEEDGNSNARFLGNIDDIRVWKKALSDTEILNNYDRLLVGTETNLIAYWPLDEQLDNYAFDVSSTSGVSNENHATPKLCKSVITVPDQLKLYTISDTDGNYVLRGIRYSDGGTNYIVKPTLGIHEFSPQQNTRFVSSSSLNHSAVDFDDISSFPVSGVVYYKNTNYPVKDATFYVDGTICSKDGEPCKTSENGTYTISVPIGNHFIQIKKDGHVFCNNGRYPSDVNNVGTTTNFNQTVSNLTFYDSTLVVVAGRVVGGNFEDSKPLGMGLSKNNIGKATITLTAGSYSMNKILKQSGTMFSYEDNTVNVPIKTTAGTAYRKGGGAEDVKYIIITTDKNTGEFAALLPPVEYKVNSIKINSNDSIVFNPEAIANINATNPLSVSTDSTKLPNGTMKYFSYCTSLKKKFNSTPTFTVADANHSDGLFGDIRYTYQDAHSTAPEDVLFIENGAYLYKYPIFTEMSNYKFNIKGYERYVNKDNKDSIFVTQVPLQGASITITNEMSAIQKVYVDDTASVKAGTLVDSLQNQLSLDSLGTATYEWTGGLPNIIDPYTRQISISFFYNGNNYAEKFKMQGYLLGSLPSGHDFVTDGPDKVLMILRDPPGTGSRAYWETGITSTTTETNAGSFTTNNSETTNSDLGYELTTIEGTPGFGVINTMKEVSSLEVGLNINFKYTGTHSKVITSTTTKRISTSDGADFVGAKGDVFIGNSTNVIFGVARKIGLMKDENNKFYIGRKDLISTGSRFGTFFSYTQNYVEQTLIPNLLKMRNSYLKTVSSSDYMSTSYVNNSDSAMFITTMKPTDAKYGTSNTDSITWPTSFNKDASLTRGPSYRMVLPENADTTKHYLDKVNWCNQQIANWKRIMASNERAKLTAIDNPKKWLQNNYSIDSGASLEMSVQNDSIMSFKEEENFETLFVLGYSNDFKIKGTGVNITDKTETGGGGNWTQGTDSTSHATTGFSIVETGDDDSHTIDVFQAPDGFGAIFVTRGGRTSCPYEGQEVTKYYKPGSEISAATAQVEVPKIRVKNPVISDVPSGKKATFILQLSNLSETGENVWFDLVPLSTDAAKYASLSLTNGPFNKSQPFLVNAEDTLNVVMQLAQLNTDVLDFDHIGIVLCSQCQNDVTGANAVIADTCYVSAHFVPSSSDITLNIDNRVMNMFTSDTLSMNIRDYDATYKNFKAIRIQYKGERDASWNLAKEYVINSAYKDKTNEMLPEGGNINFKFPMGNESLYPDQTYLFRAITVTSTTQGEVTKSSEIIPVVKDMAPPRLLGYAKPANGILSKGDEISVLFNENIKGSQLTDADNFIISGIMNGSKVAHDVGLKLEGTDQAAYTQANIQLASKSFSVDTWVNYHGAGTIFSHGNGSNKFTVGTDETGHLVVNIDSTTYTSEKILPQNKWDFLTFNYNYAQNGCTLSALVAYDAESVNLFDSEPVATYTGTGHISIGKNLNGAIQELCLWDRARTLAESQAEMYDTKSPSTPYLIGYWKFDEGEGTKATDYARNRHMTLPIANWYLNNVNKAVTLDGTNYVALDITACSALATDDYAYEMWFRGENQVASTLFSVGDDKLSIGFDAIGQLQMYSSGATTVLSTTKYLDNAWHHLAFNVLRNGNAITYVDGVAVKQVAASLVQALAGNAIYVGASRHQDNMGNHTFDNYFKGSIDEVRFWKATLSANSIRANRITRLSGKEDGLVAYYPFEQKKLDEYNQVIASGSEIDAVTDSLKATSNFPLVYSDDAPSLKVAGTETNVNYSYVASDNSIVLSLNEPAAKIEGCTINFVVRNVRDANNNTSEPIHWSAYISQNQLKWGNSNESIKQQSLESSKFTATIVNKSGSTENWTLSNMPQWLTADVTGGSLAAQTTKTINFTVNSSTPIGKYEETVYLSGNDEIYEPFTINLEVSGQEPNWTVDPKAYESSMNIIGQLKMANLFSEDTSDKIAAFINGECRGVASPVYYPRYDSYYVMMDIYANAKEAGLPVTFKVWDAGTGTVYPSVTTSAPVKFTSDKIIGSMAQPFIWIAENMIQQDLDLVQGWNWISLYTQPANRSVSILLNSIKPDINTIKGKTSFATPKPTSWGGELTLMNVGSMYKIKMNQKDTLSIIGEAVKAATSPVTIHPNWNWIGYNATYNVSVADAFAELNPADGDQVKGQAGFAMYQGYEWVGTLQALTPGYGYMYLSKATQNRSFHYPSSPSVSTKSRGFQARSIRQLTAFTPVSENEYPGNMTMVARVQNGSIPIPNAEVGVFADDECRSAEVSDEDGFVYLTVAGEGTGTKLIFKVYSNEKTTEVDQNLIYTDDETYGTVTAPYIIQLDPNLTAVSATSNAQKVNIYPARIKNDVHVDAGKDVSLKRIMIQDAGGRILYSQTTGLNDKNVIPMSSYADGIYFIVVETTGSGTTVKRVVK
jgi:hypothetical protein